MLFAGTADFYFSDKGQFILCAGINTRAFLPPDSLPVPEKNKRLLFYLQRSNDDNTVVYEINHTNNRLNENAPVLINWIRYEEEGQKEEISYIEKKFAYGIEHRKINDSNYELRLVSYSKHPLYLMNSGDNTYKVLTRINGKLAKLERIFIQVDGGTFWSPNVTYIELRGTDVGGNVISQRIKP